MGVNHIQVRSKGVIVIPAELRKELGIEEGSLLLIEKTEKGLMLRPAVAVPVETYTPVRKAQFLLNDAFDAASYARARELVAAMGLDPDTVPHERPTDTGVSGREHSAVRRAQS